MAIDTGNGATVGFATSSWSGAIHRISSLNQRVPSLNTSVLATTGYERWQRGDLNDMDAVELQVFYDAHDEPPFTQAVEIVTITYPNSGTAPATIVGNAWVEEVERGELANNEMISGIVRVRFEGRDDVSFNEGT